jgi:excisionase
MRRLAETNEGSFALYSGNRYLICRPRFEEYLLKLMENTSEAAEALEEEDE